MIEEYPHLRAPRSMFEDLSDLFHGYAGEPLDKLRYEPTVFKIFKKRRNRHSRSAEYPRATDALGIAFDSGARGPVHQ